MGIASLYCKETLHIMEDVDVKGYFSSFEDRANIKYNLFKEIKTEDIGPSYNKRKRRRRIKSGEKSQYQETATENLYDANNMMLNVT